MAQHERGYRGRTDEWLTPRELVAALGPFDLDPCAPVQRPWATATHHYTVEDDGLRQPWFGRVWLNPPYGPQVSRWLQRLAEHGEGIALVFARTETDAFARWVWERADAVLFLAGRLRFCDVAGRPSTNNAGAGSVLVAFGHDSALRLSRAKLKGKFIRLRTSVEPAQECNP
jgi:hypothetical protein